jgi:hypothetical protein
LAGSETIAESTWLTGGFDTAPNPSQIIIHKAGLRWFPCFDRQRHVAAIARQEQRRSHRRQPHRGLDEFGLTPAASAIAREFGAGKVRLDLIDPCPSATTAKQ